MAVRRTHERWVSALSLLVATEVVAQTPPKAMSVPALSAALAALERDNAWTLEQQSSICQIAAPPFKESVRGAEFAKRLRALGISDVRIDSVGNVIAQRKGTAAGPTVVVSGHLDTVFPEGTDVAVKQNGTKYKGPGIGDDCRGLAVVLAVAKAFADAKVTVPGTVLFVGTVGEEGAGDLRGVRHLFGKELAGKVSYFISVDGAGFAIVSRAVGSVRYRVSYSGPGGHSYGAFGMPNPIHALGRAVAKISAIQVPASPKTTFNVGMIRGGTSVNSIATEASIDVDMRSESPDLLKKLEGDVGAALSAAMAEENARWPESSAKVHLRVDTIGVRPAGAQPDTAYIVRTALGAARAVGGAPRLTASSTDANLAISLGIPAITVGGGGTGGGAHSPDEWYDDGPAGFKGPQFVALLIYLLAGGVNGE